ncbi:MAG: sensor histidine kinase [Actinomycetota bacterium]|nr:sensor histidine kinase [Actinomycetota bacterium]
MAARLAMLALLGAVLACLVCLAACLICCVVGLWLLPPTVGWLRAIANSSRRIVAQVQDEPVPARYAGAAPLSATSGNTGLRNRFRLCRDLLTDAALWRDLRWTLIDSTAGAIFALVPLGLILYGIFGLLVQPFLWRSIDRAGGSNWYTFVKVDSSTASLVAAAIGVLLIVAGYLVGGTVLTRSARLSGWLLSQPSNAQLQQRVTYLTDTRATARDAQAAELRRIERDLHDGAQARLVAMGMNLGNAERLLDSDPQAVRALLVDARLASSQALDELRDLVRGIHPPVLSDRGLVDAVRALALDSAIEIEVVGSLPARLEPPVESAAYFAISELMTNAAKHAQPCTLWITISYSVGAVHATVADDGPGGADPLAGSGLRGVSDRLATFDGTMTVSSPRGGPTTIGLEIPCVLLSPKTSTY